MPSVPGRPARFAHSLLLAERLGVAMSSRSGGTKPRKGATAASAGARPSARREIEGRGFQEVPRNRYVNEADSAAELTRRALNEIVTTSRRGGAWEERIARQELARYRKGDESPPKVRPPAARETLAAENKRLSEDTFRTYLWVMHGPGYAGVGHDQTTEMGARFRALRDALNDNVQRVNEENTARRLATAQRQYGKLPGMHDFLNGHPAVFRMSDGTYQVARLVGSLDRAGGRVQVFAVRGRKPLSDLTAPVDRIARTFRGTAENGGHTFVRSLPTDWRPGQSIEPAAKRTRVKKSA